MIYNFFSSFSNHQTTVKKLFPPTKILSSIQIFKASPFIHTTFFHFVVLLQNKDALHITFNSNIEPLHTL